MKTLKNTSKKALQFASAFFNAKGNFLHDIYKTWSFKKQLAYDWCKQQYIMDNGYGFRIISYNTFQFTCAWEIINPETKHIDLRVETKSQSYLIPNYQVPEWVTNNPF